MDEAEAVSTRKQLLINSSNNSSRLFSDWFFHFYLLLIVCNNDLIQRFHLVAGCVIWVINSGRASAVG
jgi:hypothetical protein